MKFKICSKCKIEKEFSNYHNFKSNKDGKHPTCKECRNSIYNEYYKKEQEKIKQSAKNYYKENKEKILEKWHENSIKNYEYRKSYYELNKEKENERSRNYRIKNKEKIKLNRIKYREENKDKINESSRNRLKNNPKAKLAKKMRNRLNDFLDNKKLDKKYKLSEYLGCSLGEFKQHIESLFEPGMTWENHGYGKDKWHLDHIISLANAKNEQQIYNLCYYKNIRPYWHDKNIKEQNRASICWQKLQRDRLIDEDIKSNFPQNTKASDWVLSQEKLSKEHRQFIERYEWLGTIGFGVRYVFTARYNGVLGGVVMIAEPNSYQFDKKLECLIQRGACASLTPKNLGSRLVMFACNWMINNTTKRIFVAYSDPEAGEIGTIYQACNFDYIGNNFGSDYNYELENGKIVNSRYFTRTSSMKKWAKILNIPWEDHWDKLNGFQNLENIPEDVYNTLKIYAKNQMDKCKKVKKQLKGKYVLLLKHKKEDIKKNWSALPYPKRT